MQDGYSQAGTGFESLPFKLEHLASCWPQKCSAIFQSKRGCSVVSAVYMLENPSFYLLLSCLAQSILGISSGILLVPAMGLA